MALTEVLKEIEAISFDGHRTQAEMGFNSLLRYGLGNITMGLSKLKLRWQAYLFEIVQNIALVHVNMSRNFKQFGLLLCVHLDCLGVLFPRLPDLNVITHDLENAMTFYKVVC